MRKLSSQLISVVVIITLVASLLSLVLSDRISSVIFSEYSEDDALTLRFAFKEVLLPVIIAILSWIQISIYSKGITTPISDLTKATMKIAAGNFDTQITEKTQFKEIAQLQANFNMMARELHNNEVLKKDFVTNISHEFKTPLAVIKGYADLLCDPNISESERIEYAAAISKETERLSTLTSNMLRMSRLNNQEIIVSPHMFALDEQIRRCVLMLSKKWGDKNIDLDIDLLPVNYTGDEDLLSQVWLNLIDNAIKYTNDNGKIRITLTTKPNGDIIVDVMDNGIGMNQKAQVKVFEQFYQADKSRSKDGNGLGLAIVQRIVKLHHGVITVKSEEGKGSDFKVVLPIHR